MDDFIIIGGGIAGISAAARLSEHGTCRVLESEAHLAYHSSGRSAALYEENYGSPSTIALAKAGRADWDDFLDGVLSPRGFMLLCLRGEKTQFDADRRHMDLTEISMAEAHARVPILNPQEVLRAACSTTAQDIDTDMMLQRFAKLLRRNGGVIETHQSVQAIQKIAGGWQVTCQEQTFTARRLINAAGAWGDEIAALAGLAPIGLTPMRRSVARLAAPGGHDPSTWPMLFGPG